MWPLCRIFSISVGDLRMILSSPKLIIVSAGSLRRQPALAAVAIDHAENLRRNLDHGLVGIHGHQPLLLPVVIRDRPGLLLIGSQPLRNDFGTIVIPGNERSAIHVTQLIHTRWLEVDVIEPSTGGT